MNLGKDRRRPLGPVHVKPHPLLPGNCRQLPQRVHRAGIGGPGNPDNADGEQSVLPVVPDRRFQGRKIQLQGLVHRDPA